MFAGISVSLNIERVNNRILQSSDFFSLRNCPPTRLPSKYIWTSYITNCFNNTVHFVFVNIDLFSIHQKLFGKIKVNDVSKNSNIAAVKECKKMFFCHLVDKNFNYHSPYSTEQRHRCVFVARKNYLIS